MDPVTLSALVAGGTSLAGGFMGNSASQKQAAAQERAAQLQYEAAQQAIAENRRQYDTTRSDYAPYRGAGTTSLSSLMAGMDSGAYAAPEFDYQEKGFDFSTATDPGAQYRMDRAMKAIQASAAAKGGLTSTGTLRSLMGESQDMASQEWNNAYNRNKSENATAYGQATDKYNRAYGSRQDTANRLQSLAGMGMSAVGGTTQAGQAATNNIGSLGMAGASALGAGMTGSADSRAAGTNALWSGVSDAANTGLGAYLYSQKNGWRNPGVSLGTTAGYQARRDLGIN